MSNGYLICHCMSKKDFFAWCEFMQHYSKVVLYLLERNLVHGRVAFGKIMLNSRHRLNFLKAQVEACQIPMGLGLCYLGPCLWSVSSGWFGCLNLLNVWRLQVICLNANGDELNDLCKWNSLSIKSQISYHFALLII